MSTLLSNTAVLGVADDAGAVYKSLIRGSAAIDIANLGCQTILSDLATNLAAADPQQFAMLTPYVVGTYGAAPSSGGSTSAANPFGSVAGIGPGSFGTGQGLINRLSIVSGGFFAFLEGLRKALSAYGSALGMTNLSSFAAYQNAITNYACLFSPDFAALYWYAYNQAQMLGGPAVFAPEGIVLASFAISGSGAGAFTPGAYPAVNGYTAAPLGVACGLVTVTAAGASTLSGAAAGAGNAVAYTSAAIVGTLSLVATAPNQNGVGRTFTVVLDNAAAGSIVSFSPAVSGDLMSGAPTAVSATGTCASGTAQIVAGGPTADEYGNAVWIGGLPMAQGFAPLKNAVLAVTADTNGAVVATIDAPNQAGIPKTWITTIGAAQTAGYSTPVTIGDGTAGSSDRIGGAPTAITVTGAATAGTIQVQSGAPERDY